MRNDPTVTITEAHYLGKGSLTDNVQIVLQALAAGWRMIDVELGTVIIDPEVDGRCYVVPPEVIKHMVMRKMIRCHGGSRMEH